MRKKILILGATGMLGHQVYFNLRENGDYDVIPIAFRSKLTEDTIILDLNNKQDLETLLKEKKPDYIINCVGVLIKGANKNPANAIYLNSYLPHLLVQICDEIDAKLVHVSTDCVFSGETGSYIETDEKDGKDIYSKTKALGEVENSAHLTLRTSIIGPELKENGEGLFHWFMGQENSINGYQLAFWSGVTTIELAKAISAAIDQGIGGLYHVVNNKKISKFDLLNLFNKMFRKNHIVINPSSNYAIDKSLVNTRNEFSYEVPSYYDMISEMLNWMSKNKNLYPHYKF